MEGGRFPGETPALLLVLDCGHQPAAQAHPASPCLLLPSPLGESVTNKSQRPLACSRGCYPPPGLPLFSAPPIGSGKG